MNVHMVVLMIMFGAVLFVPAVSATVVEEKDGYVVTPSPAQYRLPDMYQVRSTGFLTQGRIDSYSTYVPSGKTRFIADLYWGNAANSLSLTIDAPDSQLGPYYDSADGSLDGRISLQVRKTGGLSPGTWWSDICGYAVNGAQSYSYVAYAN